jgi:ABC-type spermidine/putrescine transport system permease subunit II
MKKYLLLVLPLGVFLCFFVLPLMILVKVSLASPQYGSPPFSTLLQEGRFIFDFSHYAAWLSEIKAFLSGANSDKYSLFLLPLFNSLGWAMLTSLLCVAMAYPLASYLVKQSTAWQSLCIVALFLPFLTPFLLRLSAWTLLLKDSGLVQQLLIFLGREDSPLGILYTPYSFLLGMLHSYFLLAILPLYLHCRQRETALYDAAADLGASPVDAFFSISLPLALPALKMAFLMVFLPCLGEYLLPEFLGGGDWIFISKRLVDEVGVGMNWPAAAATALMTFLAIFMVLGLCKIGLMLLKKILPKPVIYPLFLNRIFPKKCPFFLRWLLLSGLGLFLFSPLLVLIVYSFNQARLVMVWQAFSLNWYVTLFHHLALRDTLQNSLTLAFFSATLAVFLGVLAALGLAKYDFFESNSSPSKKWPTFFIAPLLIPEVMLGFALLLNSVTWATWGIHLIKYPMLQLILGHALLYTPYAFVVMRGQLSILPRRYVLAAATLGLGPMQRFWRLIFPYSAMSLTLSWCLIFILSLDNYLVSSFLSRAGTSTLPLWLFSALRLGITPEVYALSTLMILALLCVLLLARLWVLRRRF